MASYSNWVTARRKEYADAISEAYQNAGASNAYGEAWTALSGDSDIADLLPTATDNSHKIRFWNTGGPTAAAPEILRFGAWLQANTATASKLNLSVQTTVDAGAQSSLTNVGIVGSEFRQWKGQQVYTFANGIVVGRGSKLIASLGASIPELTSGLGTDVLIYFDGIPNSKGSTTRGTTVFNGDVVVSGSIQGVGGIVIIDDVIQLETGVHNPAGIGVNDAGKIMLRDRGDGFIDLIDSTERLYTGSIEQSKIWVGTQNTNSARHGTTLIPNGNFSQVTAVEESGTVVEYPSGAVTIGETAREVNFHTNGSTIDYGVLSFDADGGAGFLMPAIPIECESYKVVVRYKAGTSTVDAGNSGNDNAGIYFFFHETSDGATTGLGAKEYVYHSSGGKAGTTSIQSGISPYTTNTTEQWLNPSSNNSYPNQGSNISDAWTITTFTYNPTKSGSPASLAVNWASFGVFAKNSGNQKILFDYIVMTPRPPLASDIAADIAAVDQGLTTEVGSKIPDADFPTSSVAWRAWPISGAHSDTSLTILPTGGDNNPATGADSAAKIKLGAISTNCGLLSDAFYRENDRYSIGVRIRADANCDIKLCVVEETGNIDLFNSNSYVTPTGANVVEVGTAKNTGAVDLTSVQVTQTITGDNSSPYTWYNVFGTYTVTGLSTVSSSSTPPTSNINRISFLLKVLTAGVDAYIDYAWMAPQTSSADISTALANQAVGDANTFVTDINDKLVKESGSLIPNASMAMPSSAISTDPPAGYRNHNATLTTETDATTGDKRIKVVPTAATGTLISPAFDLGSGNSSDKYAIGVLVKAQTTANIVVKVAYHTKQLSEQAVLDSKSGGYTTLAPTASSTDVLTGVSATARASEGTTSTWENILMTWDKKAVDNTAMVASVLVQGDATFYVDYIYAAAQACSFDLADTQAQARRDEAIAQASGALQGLTNGLNQEQGSLLANSSFGSYLYDSVLTKQVPKNWAWTRSTTSLHRVVSATEVTSYNGQTGPAVLGEVVDNKSQVGACGLVTTGGTVNGILSSYFTLPFVPSTESTFTVDSTDYSPVGKYTLSLKLKVSSANAVGIRLLAHESKSVPNSNQEFILCTTTSSSAYANTTSLSATARASSIHSDYSTKTLLVNDTTGSTSLIKVINITQEDTQPGLSSSDEYIEFFPVDTADKGGGQSNQGDLDATVENIADWYSVAGTYTPSTGAKFVSFEIIIEDTNAGSGRADVYIDYISLVAQTMDADFASTLAQARTEDLMDNLEAEPPQTGNLLENPYFTTSIKRTRSSKNYPKKWVPYGYNPRGSFDFLQFANPSLFRGAKILGKVGSTSYQYPGLISRAFRTIAPDYEITVRLKRNSSADGDVAFQIAALEYDSDIDDNIEVIGPAANMPTSVASIVQAQARYKYLTDTSDSDNSITRSDGGSVTTANVSGTQWIDMEHDNYVTYKIQYIPTSTARYASFRIMFRNENDEGVSIAMFKCAVDTPYKIMDRHLSTLFGNGDNLATLLGTPSKVFTGPLGITNVSEIKNTNITLTKSGGEFTFNGSSLGALSATDVGAKDSSYSPTLSEITTGLGITGVNDIKNNQVNQTFIETAMGSGWSKADTLNSNVVTGTAALGYTPFHAGNKPTKGDVGLGAVQNYSATDLAGLTAFTDNFNKFEASDAVTAAGGMNLLNFSNFGNKVKGVTQYKLVNPYKNYAPNGDFKLMTDTDAYIDAQSVDQGVYPTGCWFGSTNFGTTPNDADGEDGGSQLGSFAGNIYTATTSAGKSLKYTGGYDSGNISHTPPSWYYPHINEDTDGNYINLAAFGHGITFSSQKIAGGAKVKVKFQAKCAVRSTGALLGSFWAGDEENDISNRQLKWQHLPNAIEGALAVTIQGYADEEDKDFYVATTTNAECPANRDASARVVDGGTDEYIAQKTVTVSSTSWATYSADFIVPDDLEAFCVSIGRKANWTHNEFLTACPTWQHDETPIGYTGNGTNAYTVYADKGETWYNSYLDAATNTSGNTTNPHSSYDYVAGWEIADINSRLIASGGGVEFNYSGHSASWTSKAINNDANYISVRNVECKEVSGLTLSAMVTLKSVSYSVGGGGFRAPLLGSDASFKQDIEPASNAMDLISQLPVSRFRWIPRESEAPEDMEQVPKSWGMIAQDVETVHETFVGRSKRTSGIKLGLNADELIALSVKAIQEQQEIIESQRKDIDDLKELVNKLVEDKNNNDDNDIT